MINGYSLKSIVDQMKSDGRSFEEIQSVVAEYKRRQESQPVTDIVGITMEDVPLEEFVAPEKPQLRYINYPQKNKKTGVTEFKVLYEDEYNNIYKNQEDYPDTFEEYANSLNANIYNVEEIEQDIEPSMVGSFKKGDVDKTLEAYKKEVAELRESIIPENFEREIIDYIFQPYISGQITPERDVDITELPLKERLLEAGRRTLAPPDRLPADLRILFDEKGKDNITLEDIQENYGEEIFNFINEKRRNSVNAITKKYKEEFGLTKEDAERLEFDSLPGELGVAAEQVSTYNKTVKARYRRDLSEAGFTDREIQSLMANMVPGQTYKIPTFEGERDVLDLGMSKAGKYSAKYPEYWGKKKYTLAKFDREAEVNKYITNSNKLYENYERDLEKQVAFINQKSAPYIEQLKAIETELRVLYATGEAANNKTAIENLNIKKQEILNNYHQSGIKKDQEVLDNNMRFALDYANELEKTSEELDDLNLMMYSSKLNYDMFDRLLSNLNSNLVSPIAFGAGAFTALTVGNLLDVFDPDGEYAKDIFNSSVDYYTLVQEEAKQFPQGMSIKEVGSLSDFGDWSLNTLVDGAPSILAVLGPQAIARTLVQKGGKAIIKDRMRGALTQGDKLKNQKLLQYLNSSNPTQAAIAKRAMQASAIKNASKLSMGLFFGMSGAGKFGELETSWRNAEENIKNLRAQIDNTNDLNLKQDLLQQLDYYEDAADSGRWQRALTGAFYGGIEMLSERLGTLRYINGIQKVNKYSRRTGIQDTFVKGWTTSKYWKNRFKQFGYGTLQTGKNVGIETVEEIVAQMGQNMMDKVIMGNTKSIMEGVDIDLMSRSAMISLGLQSPQLLGNVNNIFQNELSTYRQVKQNRVDTTRLLEIEQQLEQNNLSRAEINLLQKEKKAIQDKLVLGGFMTYQKWGAMSNEEKTQYIQDREALNFKEQQYYQMISNPRFGEKGFRETLESMEKEIIKDNEKLGEYLNNKKYKEYKEFTKSLEGTGKMLTNPTIAAANVDLYTAALALAEHHFDGETLNLKDNQAVEDYITENNLDQESANQLRNSYAFVNGNQMVVNEAKVFGSIAGQMAITEAGAIVNLQTESNFERFRAAISPLHELAHMEINSKKVFSDLFPEAKAAATSVIDVLGKQVQKGKLKEEVFNNIKNVLDKAYTDENGVVDVDEILTTLSESMIAGDITQSMFAEMYGMKYFLNGMFRKAFPKIASIVSPFKTANDMFNFVSNFVDKKTSYVRSAVMVPEEKKETVQTSAAMDMMKELTNEELVEVIKSPSTSQAQRQAAENVLFDASGKIGLKAIGYDTRKGDISRENVLAEIQAEIVKRDLVNKFTPVDPKTGETRTWSTYVGNQISFEAPNIFEKAKTIAREGERIDRPEARQVAEEQVEATREAPEVKPTIDIFTILPEEVRQEAQEEVDKKIKENNIDISDKELSFKELKQIAPYETLAKFFNIPVSRITNPKDNLRKGDNISEIQRYILKNIDRLINTRPQGNAETIQTQAFGGVKAKLEGGESTGLSRKFLNTEYDKVLDAKGKQVKINNNLQYKLRPGNRTRFLEASGITSNKVNPDFTPRSGESQFIKGVLEILARNMGLSSFGKYVNEQAEAGVVEKPRAVKVRAKAAAGKAPLLKFSKPVFTGKTDTWKNILASGKITPIDMKTEDGRKAFKAWMLKPGVSKKLSEAFWRNYGTFTGTTEGLTIEELGIIEGKYIEEYIDEEGLPAIDKFDVTFFEDGKTKRLRTYAGNFAFLNNEEVEAIVNQMVEFAAEDADVTAAVSKDSYNKIETKLNDENFVDKQDRKLKGLYKIFKAFEELMQEDKANIPFVAALLSSTSAYQGHFVRTSAPIRFYSIDKTGGLTEEHTLPASMVAKYLFIQAANNNLNEDTFKGIQNNYFQGGLRSYDDKKLKGIGVNGVKYNYVAKAPEDWTLDQSIWLRYFNPNVANTRGGIDPNGIMLAGNKTAAQVLNLNVKGQPTTPALNKSQIKVAPKNNKKQPKISQFSKGVSNETVLDNMRMIDQALDNARDINAEPKGISIYDFDDTLAFSKSKVIVIMPQNLEGISAIDKLIEENREIGNRILAFRNEQELKARRRKIDDLETQNSADELRALYSKAKGQNKEDIKLALQEKYKAMGPEVIADSQIDIMTGEVMKITPAQFATDAAKLENQGAIFDFSEFNKVVDGKPGPLVPRLRKAIKKFGNENIFVLTARPQASAQSIYDFLKGIGVELPLDNIVGLEDGRPQAKANWVISKAAEGYNDFYFVDDAVKNVKAVAKVLEQVDVNSKVQQAKIRFSKSLDADFNKMIEGKTGIGVEKEYSAAKAQVVGAGKGKFKFFIPPSADDFVGLMYYLLGKGKEGDAQMAWIKTHLLDPYARAMASISTARINMENDYKALKKELGIVPKNLRKQIPGEGFTVEQAVRVYMWDKQGMNIPGLSKTDLKELTDYVKKNKELQIFGDNVINILKGEQYVQPKAGWLAGTITTDLINTLDTTKRAKYLEQWQNNVDIIFSEKNMNKLEAAFGKSYRDALENMLQRMKSGRNRGFAGDSLTGRFTDWTTNSIGTIMFFNTRSALLQTISAVNFINFSDNNILAASKAFADQKQFWKDFMYLMNSDFLKERRGGLRFNVNETDIADMAREGGPRAIISKMLQFGFLPTQIADSFAIASGGATMYRNRIKTYLKQGLSQKEAEEKAFMDFREIAEESQQSSRPDRISQQQAGPLGRIILAFANTPMQYNRLIGKAISDLRNRRGNTKANISKIIYYAFVQNLIFTATQQALFAIAFGDNDDEEEDEKVTSIANSMSDTLLRGLGFGGAVVSVIKNAILRAEKESKKDRPNYEKIAYELTRLSPPISSKLSRINQAARSYQWDKDKMQTMGFDIQNPAFLAAANVISAATNVPIDRAIRKMINIDDAFSQDLMMWERMALLGGWSAWEIGIDKDATTKAKKQIKKNRLKLRSGLKIKGLKLKK